MSISHGKLNAFLGIVAVVALWSAAVTVHAQKTEQTASVEPGDAIQAALAELAEAGGGTCLLEAGTHVISETISLPSNIVFTGDGIGKTVLKMDSAVTEGPMIANAEENMHDVVIRKMTIDAGVGQRETPAYKGDDSLPPRRILAILLVAMERPYQRNVRLEKLCVASGAMNVHIKGCENLAIHRCEFKFGGGFKLLHNLYLRRVHRCEITDCYSHDSRAGAGFQASFSSDLTLARNLAIDNSGHGVRVAACKNASITDNVLIGNRNGLWLNCEKGRVDRNITCNDNIARFNREAGIWIRNTHTGQFNGNICLDNGFDFGFRNAFEVVMRGNRYETTREKKRNTVTFEK